MPCRSYLSCPGNHRHNRVAVNGGVDSLEKTVHATSSVFVRPLAIGFPGVHDVTTVFINPGPSGKIITGCAGHNAPNRYITVRILSGVEEVKQGMNIHTIAARGTVRCLFTAERHDEFVAGNVVISFLKVTFDKTDNRFPTLGNSGL